MLSLKKTLLISALSLSTLATGGYANTTSHDSNPYTPEVAAALGENIGNLEGSVNAQEKKTGMRTIAVDHNGRIIADSANRQAAKTYHYRISHQTAVTPSLKEGDIMYYHITPLSSDDANISTALTY
tara:strand:+ start:669 stop:1049 length:381 start_codon:yes stop_codon:yes gene_type:complete